MTPLQDPAAEAVAVDPPGSSRARLAVAWIYGFVCHGTFAVAVALMIRGLHDGMTSGGGTLTGAAAWWANAGLAVQFPVVHSFLLSRRGRRLLSRLAPRGLGERLSTTTYAWIASIQLIAVFGLWSPSGLVLWSAAGGARMAMNLVYAASWLIVARAIYDAGLPLQTGSLGWTAVVRDRRPHYPAMPDKGLFAVVRQPIYLGFALTLWTGPVLTADRLVLAGLWTAHCVLSPLFKEERYRRRYGAKFAEYRSRVPYLLPFPRPLGARRNRAAG